MVTDIHHVDQTATSFPSWNDLKRMTYSHTKNGISSDFKVANADVNDSKPYYQCWECLGKMHYKKWYHLVKECSKNKTKLNDAEVVDQKKCILKYFQEQLEKMKKCPAECASVPDLEKSAVGNNFVIVTRAMEYRSQRIREFL